MANKLITRYVLGFAFTEDRKQVALIEKKRPAWQAGNLNGIGGHVEDKESLGDAQCREFYEETGVTVPYDAWQIYAALYTPGDWHVTVFRAFTNSVFDVASKTDERVGISFVNDLFGGLPKHKMLFNLNYLIPLALDKQAKGVTVFYY